jgi:hypothetical protein
MTNSPIASLSKHFQNLTDPRAEHSIDHLLIDLVIITICAFSLPLNDVMVVERFTV